MSDDRRRILDLLAQNKITVEEADQLLAALAGRASGGEQKAAQPEADNAPRYMRIVVKRAPTIGAWPGVSRPEKNVNIRIPLSLVRSGMRLGAIVPGGAGELINQVLRQRGVGVDFSKIDPNELVNALKGMGELTVDVDQGRAQVHITCE
jgi:hypothetical protein